MASLTKLSEVTETFGAGSVQGGRRCICVALKHPGRRKEDAGIYGEEKPPLMTPGELQKHICKESLVKDVVWDDFSVHHPDSGLFAAKVQNMLLQSTPKNWNRGTPKSLCR